MALGLFPSYHSHLKMGSFRSPSSALRLVPRSVMLGTGVEGQYVELFPKYYTKSHFFMGNNVYVYKEDDLSN